MRRVSVADSDILALGGSLPRRGFLQVWRITVQGTAVDRAKVREISLAGADVGVDLDETDATSVYLLAPRGVPGLSGGWNVSLPAGEPIGLSTLVVSHAVDPTTLQPLDPTPPTLEQLLDQRLDERLDGLSFKRLASQAEFDALPQPRDPDISYIFPKL